MNAPSSYINGKVDHKLELKKRKPARNHHRRATTQVDDIMKVNSSSRPEWHHYDIVIWHCALL